MYRLSSFVFVMVLGAATMVLGMVVGHALSLGAPKPANSSACDEVSDTEISAHTSGFLETCIAADRVGICNLNVVQTRAADGMEWSKPAVVVELGTKENDREGQLKIAGLAGVQSFRLPHWAPMRPLLMRMVQPIARLCPVHCGRCGEKLPDWGVLPPTPPSSEAALANARFPRPQFRYRKNQYTPGEDGTYAQNYQDLWFEVLAAHNGWLTRRGFYLDLGAYRPLECSNTVRRVMPCQAHAVSRCHLPNRPSSTWSTAGMASRSSCARAWASASCGHAPSK